MSNRQSRDAFPGRWRPSFAGSARCVLRAALAAGGPGLPLGPCRGVGWRQRCPATIDATRVSSRPDSRKAIRTSRAMIRNSQCAMDASKVAMHGSPASKGGEDRRPVILQLGPREFSVLAVGARRGRRAGVPRGEGQDQAASTAALLSAEAPVEIASARSRDAGVRDRHQPHPYAPVAPGGPVHNDGGGRRMRALPQWVTEDDHALELVHEALGS